MPTLNPHAIAPAVQILRLLSPECREDGGFSECETGYGLSWTHRGLFCYVDTQEDDAPLDAPIVIMVHWLTPSGVDHVEYPPTPEMAATRLMALWM